MSDWPSDTQLRPEEALNTRVKSRKMSLKNTLLKSHPHLPGISDLNIDKKIYIGLSPGVYLQ